MQFLQKLQPHGSSEDKDARARRAASGDGVLVARLGDRDALEPLLASVAEADLAFLDLRERRPAPP